MGRGPSWSYSPQGRPWWLGARETPPSQPPLHQGARRAGAPPAPRMPGWDIRPPAPAAPIHPQCQTAPGTPSPAPCGGHLLPKTFCYPPALEYLLAPDTLVIQRDVSPPQNHSITCNVLCPQFFHAYPKPFPASPPQFFPPPASLQGLSPPAALPTPSPDAVCSYSSSADHCSHHVPFKTASCPAFLPTPPSPLCSWSVFPRTGTAGVAREETQPCPSLLSHSHRHAYNHGRC